MNRFSILIIDDEKFIRDILKEILENEGFEVYSVESGEAGIEFIKKNQPDFILLDIMLPGINGIETLSKFKDMGILQKTVVIMISGHGQYSHAVEAVKLGAFDFIEKPFSISALLMAINKGRSRKLLLNTYNKFRDEIALGFLTGTKYASILKGIRNKNLMIFGASGTGKDFIARGYASMNYSQKKFNHIDMLIDKKALKNIDDFDGVIYISNFDYIDRRNLNRLKSCNCIIIGSTKNLNYEIDPDIFQAVFYLPLLKDMPNKEDLFFFLLEKYAREFGIIIRHISDDVIEIINKYEWPGNFRELNEVCCKLVSQSDNGVILGSFLREILSNERMAFDKAIEEFKTSYILTVIRSLKWDFKKASKILEISEDEIVDFIKDYINGLRKKSGVYVWKLKSDFSEIDRIQRVIEDILKKYKVSKKRVFEIKLLIDEFLANCIEHAYENNEGEIELHLNIRGDKISIFVVDEGKGFNFEHAELPRDYFSSGGRGIYIAEKLGERFHLFSKPGKGTEIMAEKRLHDFIIVFIGKELKSISTLNFYNVSSFFYEDIRDLKYDYHNEGMVLLHESIVKNKPSIIKDIKQLFLKYSVIIVGTISTISETAEYIFYGADDFWTMGTVNAKIEAHLNKLEELLDNKKILPYEFQTLDPGLNKIKGILTGLKINKNIIVLSGEKGVGKEYLSDYIAMGYSDFKYFKYSLKKYTNIKIEANSIIFIKNISKGNKQLVFNIIKEFNENKDKIMLIFSVDNKGISDFIFEGVDFPVMNFDIPPLRKRRDDIILLSNKFIDMFCEKKKIKIKRLTDKALFLLIQYDWPKNIDELKRVIKRAVDKSNDRFITDEVIEKSLNFKSEDKFLPLKKAIERFRANLH